MGITLAAAREVVAQQADTLTEIARGKHAPTGRVIAVCKTSAGTLVLARERVVGKLVEGKRDRKAGTENVLKRTSEIADFAYALDLGLIE